MKIIFYSVFALLTAAGSTVLNAQDQSVTTSAYTQSVIGISGTTEAACGVFRTMESVRHGIVPGIKGVEVQINHPVCPGQFGSVSLVNSSGEGWKYRVIEKTGMLVTEGEVGYNRRISKLGQGAYIIQFTLADGNSFLDEFSIHHGEGLNASVEMEKNAVATPNMVLSFTGKCDGATEYAWDFGDGTVVYGDATVTHAYQTAGKYTVTLTANNFDCSTTATQQVSVVNSVAQGRSEE